MIPAVIKTLVHPCQVDGEEPRRSRACIGRLAAAAPPSRRASARLPPPLRAVPSPRLAMLSTDERPQRHAQGIERQALEHDGSLKNLFVAMKEKTATGPANASSSILGCVPFAAFGR